MFTNSLVNLSELAREMSAMHTERVLLPSWTNAPSDWLHGRSTCSRFGYVLRSNIETEDGLCSATAVVLLFTRFSDCFFSSQAQGEMASFD